MTSVLQRGHHGLGAWDETVRICKQLWWGAARAYARFLCTDDDDPSERQRLRGEVNRCKAATEVAETCRRQHIRMRLAAIEAQLSQASREG